MCSANFLLLACYVPNVAIRSIRDQCDIEDRPTNRPSFLEEPSWKSLPGRISNGYISIMVQDRSMVTMDHP